MPKPRRGRRRMFSAATFFIAAGLLLGIFSTHAVRAEVADTEFGSTRDGTVVHLFTLTNASGAEARIMSYGAAIVSLKMPDRDGKLADIVLGYDQLSGYLRNSPFFGAVVGRYGNRIGGAQFTLDGKVYKLTNNDRGNTLHGGRRGFDKVVWTGAKINAQTVEFTYLSKDGEEGFPGNLTAHARYSLSDTNELKIDYSATTDKNTVVNLTNHSYFNLAGQGNGDNSNHELMIDADHYTPGTMGMIPTGQIVPVEGTPFDFRQPHKIGERINADNEQLRFGKGYDENFVLNKKDGLRLAATVYEPTSGRVLELFTTEPGLQFYSGNGLDGTITGKGGKVYVRRGAFCLEPQHFPDSPNKPDFPSTELKAGEKYQSTSVYKFNIR